MTSAPMIKKTTSTATSSAIALTSAPRTHATTQTVIKFVAKSTGVPWTQKRPPRDTVVVACRILMKILTGYAFVTTRAQKIVGMTSILTTSTEMSTLVRWTQRTTLTVTKSVVTKTPAETIPAT